MEQVFKRPESLIDIPFHFCPGCHHGIAHRLVAEAIDYFKIREKTIGVASVGCSVFLYDYFNVDVLEAPHGRASAVAAGVKRARKDRFVFTYQGDGDLASIGIAEVIHTANRGENITIFFANNTVYGMTGGQMAPTTLVGEKSTTSPWGRRPGNEGFPLHMSELIASLEAPAYVERVALSDNKNIMRARRAVRKALETQMHDVGFSFVEILSPCPTIWNKDPIEARKWVAERMIPAFPLGVFRDRKPEIPAGNAPPQRSIAEALEIGEKANASPQTVKPAAHASNITINIAGFGGQGVLLLGQLLTEMGMREGLEVSWLPSYGPEMRSGSAHCYVCLSKERIGSPLTQHPDVLIAMNEISLRKFAHQVRRGGTIIYSQERLPSDLSLPDVQVVCIPAAKLADAMGSAKAANIVLLGALLEETDCLAMSTAERVLEVKVKKANLLEIDRRALVEGKKFVEHEMHIGAVTQPDGFA